MSEQDLSAGGVPAPPDSEAWEPWALVLSLLPLIGLAGGAIALVKGKRRNGVAMIAIGLASFVALSLVR
jgi:hypothetical protein